MPNVRGIIGTGYSLLILLCLSIAGCSGGDRTESGSQESSPLLDRARELYEKAKRSGDNVPDDIAEWMKEDLQRVDDWEYKIVRTSPANDASDNEALEALLNELGQERWDCFWVERKNGEIELFLKRPSRSYLKGLPMRDFFKLIPQDK